MNKRLSRNLSLLLCFALLLQLMAGPIGSLIPAASAAEPAATNQTTKLVKKVLYSEDFSAYTTAQALSGSAAVDGWTINGGSGLTASLTDGKLYFKNTSGMHLIRLDVPGSDQWQNYTLEADWTYENVSSNTMYYAGMAVNAIDKDNLQKAGLDDQNDSGATKYTINGRLSGGWDKNNGGPAAQSGSLKFEMNRGDTFRYRIVLSGCNGTNDSVLAFYAAKYDKDGKLGEWVEVATRANMPANLPAKGTIGVFTNNAVSGYVDNIEVYQWEEKTVETTTKTLYSEDFSSADALKVWTTSLTAGNSWEVKDGKLYIHEPTGGYDWYWLNLPANEEAGIPASSEWSDYTVEADMTYVSGTDGDGKNNGTWLGLMLNSTNTDNFLKGSVTTKYGAWANGKDHGKWMLADKDKVIKDNPMENGLEFGDTFRLRVTSSGVRTTVSMAIYEDGTLGQWKELFSHDLTGEILQKGTIGFVGGNTAGEYIIDNILVTQEVPVDDGGEEPPVNPNLPEGAKLLYEEDFSGYEGTTTLGTTAIDGWYLDLSDNNNKATGTAKISDGQLHFVNTDGNMTALLLDLPADAAKGIPASREWSNYTVEVDWDYTSSNKYYAGFIYNGQNVNNLQKAGLDININNGSTKYTVNGRSSQVASYWVNNLQTGAGVLNQTDTTKVDLSKITKWRYKIETSGNNGTDEGTTTFSVAPIVDGVRGDWVEIVTVENIYPATWKGTIGIFGRNNVACSVDNIIVYATEEQTPEEPKPTEPEPTEPEPTDPPAPPKDPFEFEGTPTTLFEEDFSEYEEKSVKLEDGMNYDLGWYKRSGGTYTAEFKDGALYVKGNADSKYGLVYLDGGTTWGNYVYEADINYISGSGTGNGATWGGLVFNVKDNGDGTYGYFKGSVNDTEAVFLNGDRNFGTGGWDFDTDKVNKDLSKKTGVTMGDTWRLRVTSVDNHAKLELAKYDAQGKLGEWTEMYRIDNIPSDMRTGTIGIMTSRGTYEFKIDNIHVYEYDNVVFNETFDYANATITTSNALTYGVDLAMANSSVARIQDGKLYFKDSGSSYDELYFLAGQDWTNYTVEVDLCHTNAQGWSGFLYRSTVGKATFQKVGLTVDNEAGNGKGLMTQNGMVGGSWYNLRTYNGTDIVDNYSNRNMDTNVKVGDVLRFKVIVNEDYAEFWAAEYTDYAKGELGEFKLWNKIEGDTRFAPEQMTGTIGIMNDGNGSGIEFWIDNIKVSHGESRMSEAPKPANVADIYLPDTGITNAPTAVQKITTALPDTSKALPAIALMEIDEELNIVGTGKTVADFYAEYRYSVIGGWIIDTEAEADALIEFIKENDILDVYIIGAESEITYFEYKEGSGVYTGTSDTVELVKKVFDAVPTIRGGLLLDGEILSSDLNNDQKVDYADLAVICNMVTNDTGITQLIFDSTISVDAMTYFNNHAVGGWSYANDAAEVYSGIATGAHAIVAEVPATIYDVYESIDTVTLSGRPVPITHRGSHMNYGRETEVVTRDDGSTFTYYGETENSVEAMLASWNYFGILGSEIDLCTTAVCSGDDATCSHTIIEGAGACDHVNCELCQTNIILEHDKNLPNTTNFNAMKAQYPEIFNHGVAPQYYTLFELKMLTLTGKGNNQPSGTRKMATLEDVLKATENLADGNYVYYCHVNHSATVDYFNKLMAEHPEYIDNCVIFEEPGEILATKGYNIKYLTAPVPITYATDGHTQAGIMQAGITELEALERVIKLFNPNMGSSLIYQYYDFTDGDDSFYYQIGARGVISYHSITTDANVNKYHITEAGAEGCLIEQPRLVDDWFYFIEAPKTAVLAAGSEILNQKLDVRTIVGDRHEADNLSGVTCSFEQLSGPKLRYDEALGGYTADAAGEVVLVYYYDGTAEGASYRIYSEPVTVTVTADPVAVELDQSAVELEVAETVTLKATVTPAGAENKTVTWTSSDETVAKVAADGTVTAIAKGEATITAETVNGLTAECVITVTGISEEAQAVVDAIDALEEVTAESGEALAQLREAYEALTPIQKAQVGNYEQLLDAEDAYVEALKNLVGGATLEEAKQKAEQAKKEAEEAKAAAAEAKTAAEAAAQLQAQAEAAAKEALENAELSEEEKEAAVAAAEQAKAAAEEAEAAAEAAEAAAKVAQETSDAAKAELDAAVKEAEELIDAANKAEAEAQLARAKYEAVWELLQVKDQLEEEVTTSLQAKRLAEAVSEAQKAVEAAETVEAVEMIKASGIDAMFAALREDAASKFVDVKDGTYYYESVEYMVSQGYMAGVSDTLFDVDGMVTRAQMVAILYRISGEPSVEGLENPFADVAEGTWYTDAVLWAASEGVVKGTSAITFSPDDLLTREQFAAMLYRWADASAEADDVLAAFADVDDVSAYAMEAMNWAVANGLIYGVTSDTLAPQNTATRAQAATILARYLA